MSKKTSLFLLALGVVFGDMGTSPLYALKTCFHPSHGIAPTPENILGISSLIFWSLSLVIIFKYITFLLRADNNGQGGMMSILSLLKKTLTHQKIPFTVLIGILGTALIYGDGIASPAISVLSSMEGLTLVSKNFSPFVIPLTSLVLIGIFTLQKKGTEFLGKFFGPILLIWFLVLGSLGLFWVIKNPLILYALNPLEAINFFSRNGFLGFLILGSVVLVVTGGEALYSSLGQFGREPISRAWFNLVYPSLVLNYFGQGALLLTKGKEVVGNPFFHMVPEYLLYPLVFLSSLATIIAAQSIITGAFSLTSQAIKLGFLPRMKIVYTSREESSQIYIPFVNYFLLAGSLILVFSLQDSSKLAEAYGLAVTGSMLVSSILLCNVMYKRWNLSLTKVIFYGSIFLMFDLSFLISSVFKIGDGAWVALFVGFLLCWCMVSWKKGRLYLAQYVNKNSISLKEFMDDMKMDKIYRTDGLAVFLSPNLDIAPFALVNNFKHNHVIHKKVAILNVSIALTPEVSRDQKVLVIDRGDNFFVIKASYGFMEIPDVIDILKLASKQGFSFKINETSFFLGKEFISPTGDSKMTYPSKKLFSIMTYNSQSARDFFKIPPDKVVEIGSQVKI